MRPICHILYFSSIVDKHSHSQRHHHIHRFPALSLLHTRREAYKFKCMRVAAAHVAVFSGKSSRKVRNDGDLVCPMQPATTADPQFQEDWFNWCSLNPEIAEVSPCAQRAPQFCPQLLFVSIQDSAPEPCDAVRIIPAGTYCRCGSRHPSLKRTHAALTIKLRSNFYGLV